MSRVAACGGGVGWLNVGVGAGVGWYMSGACALRLLCISPRIE